MISDVLVLSHSEDALLARLLRLPASTTPVTMIWLTVVRRCRNQFIPTSEKEYGHLLLLRNRLQQIGGQDVSMHEITVVDRQLTGRVALNLLKY